MSERRYLVKEMFGPTLQGEGAHAGRAVVFMRFAACNLACTGCDTDFSPDSAVRRGADEIVARLRALDTGKTYRVVVTGGEPTLQWDAPLATAVRGAGFRVHMESNGTRVPQGPVDWLTISPKPQHHPVTVALADNVQPDEVKVVIDDTVDEAVLDKYAARWRCEHYFVQPWMDDRYERHLARTLQLIHTRPRWRLSVQMHKIVGIP
ncbi:MAG TPA: 7-carboxy-7-deazaguanine synthase QueE [Kofleriaceae bacterium]|nr:7-carboxy-7-deazaguanine synthase QueE [Kofleriaceae bacterium]